MHTQSSKINWIILSLFFLSFTGCKCAPDLALNSAQEKASTPIQNDFSQAFTWSQNYDSATQQLSVDVHLNEGFHAYAEGEETGVPVDLEISDLNGWRMEGKPLLPSGDKELLENEFSVGAKVTGGKGMLRGILKMQLCSTTACDRPRQHPFEYMMPRGSQG